MSGAVPLVKAFSNGLQHSYSKIPHLRLHILQRQAQIGRSSKKTRLNDVQQKRWQHTSISIGGDFSNVSRIDASPDDETRPARRAMSGPTNTLIADAVQSVEQKVTDGAPTKELFEQHIQTTAIGPANIYEILQEGHPDRILFALLDSAIGISFVANASDNMFAGALCSLDPQHFVEPYKTIYQTLNPSLEEKPIYRYVRSLDERFDTFVSNIEKIIARRRDSGHKLDLQVYRHLFKCAEAMGDLRLAKTLWQSMRDIDGIEPDLACYNYLLAAHVWSHTYSTAERRNLRVLDRNLMFRSRNKRMKAFIGHRVSPPENPFSDERGIRHVVLEIFRDLNKKGMTADESTFANLMIGMGREKDLNGVESILKSVWNIDVDLLAKYDEEELESPTFYDENNPLRPSERLLFAIVHIFCTNNDVSTATSLLDYVARNYNLRIPEYVWKHLHEWSYVLSRRRDPKAKAKGYQSGFVDPRVVERIYSVMTDEPHNIQPTVPMIMTISKVSLKSHHHLKNTHNRIKEGLAIFHKNQTELSILFENLCQHILHIRTLSPWDGFLPAEFLNLRRRFILLSLQVDAELELVIRAIANLLRESYWIGSRHETEWSHRLLPNLIHEFRLFMPNLITYETPTGSVEIEDGQFQRNREIEESNQSLMAKVGIFRAALDTEDYDKLLRDLWEVNCDDPKGDFRSFLAGMKPRVLERLHPRSRTDNNQEDVYI